MIFVQPSIILVYFCTDLNPFAAEATLKTGQINSTPLNPIVTDLCQSLVPRIQNQVDVLVFNPPYVVTDESEVDQAQERGVLERAWAGGEFGMKVTNRVLDLVEVSSNCIQVYPVLDRKTDRPHAISESLVSSRKLLSGRNHPKQTSRHHQQDEVRVRSRRKCECLTIKI